ncbi:uncharacterized protein AB675_2403 [Cyphellophora attinorum]|uniref:Uncharacterized protein n=1 Tax=Cyphellophora attinorum TaxID=1664694 RepID=A0A0N1HGU8_9EURO|nr:uncharacterized protein AB675_2403 [Phialophora attinorum]KPI45010.1 hypothetical protein AB675_2403 [Phialophora attinorum]
MKTCIRKPASSRSTGSSPSPASSASQGERACQASSATSYSETEQFQRIESLKAIDIEPDMQDDFNRIQLWADDLPLDTKGFEKMRKNRSTTMSNEKHRSGRNWFDNNRGFALTGLPPRKYSTSDDIYWATRYSPQLRLRVSPPAGMERLTLKFCGRTVASGFVAKNPPKKKGKKSRRTW